MKYGPDFICIGAQKAGTSWLHWNLLWHPDTKLPPEKEVNFFYPLPPERLNEEYLEKLRKSGNQWVLRYDKWLEAKKVGNPEDQFDWYYNYLFSVRTIEEYTSLFPKYDNKITGDISPSYVDLTEQQIKELSISLPDTKIVYMLRDPVDRAWSAFRMDKTDFLEDSPSEADILECIKQNNGEVVCAHSRYSRVLDRWEKYFAGRVKVWFYEQLNDNPEELFLEICRYFNITPNVIFDHNKIKDKVFEGMLYTIPESVKEYLSGVLRNEIVTLHARFNNNYTEKWLYN